MTSSRKTLLKILIKIFLQKCILNANAAFIDFAAETKFQEEQRKDKFLDKLLNRAYISQPLKHIEKRSERY